MKVSALTITEMLCKELLEFPSIVNKLKNKDTEFISFLEEWMKSVEAIFKNNNVAKIAVIAGLRSKILAPLFEDITRSASKKKQWQIAAAVLYELQNTVLSVLKPYEAKVNESRDLLNQLMSIVQASGTIKYYHGENFQAFINNIWEVFMTHEQLKPGVAKVLTLISQPDALRIIAAEIELSDWV